MLLDWGVIATRESFGIACQGTKVKVVVDMDSKCSGMRMELHVPVPNDSWGVNLGKWF